MTKVKHYDYEGCHAMVDIILEGEIPSNIEEIIKEAIEKSNLNIVDNISHKFVPQGETAVYILSESHFAMSIFKNVKNIFNNPFNSTQDALQDTHLNNLKVIQ